jgi:hypothetical protein
MRSPGPEPAADLDGDCALTRSPTAEAASSVEACIVGRSRIPAVNELDRRDGLTFRHAQFLSETLGDGLNGMRDSL